MATSHWFSRDAAFPPGNDFMPFPTHKIVYARQGMDFNTTKTIMFDNDPSDLSEGKWVFLLKDANS